MGSEEECERERSGSGARRIDSQDLRLVLRVPAEGKITSKG